METLKTALIAVLCLGQLAIVVFLAVYYWVNYGLLP